MFGLNSYAAQIKPLKFRYDEFPYVWNTHFVSDADTLRKQATKAAKCSADSGNESTSFSSERYKILCLQTKILLELKDEVKIQAQWNMGYTCEFKRKMGLIRYDSG